MGKRKVSKEIVRKERKRRRVPEREEGEEVFSTQVNGVENSKPIEAEIDLSPEAVRPRLAQVCLLLTEDPHLNVRKLRELIHICKECPDTRSKKLALVSVLEVFKDVLPDYAIRALTDEEKAQPAKKETKQLREYESNLLSNYKQYLEILENRLKKDEKVQRVALDCYLELLLSHPYFNYRKNILAVVVPYTNNSKPELSNLACSKLKALLKQDRDRVLTLEVVRLISRMAKVRKFKIRPQVLDVFLALKIKEIETEADKAEDKRRKREEAKKMSRRDKKRKKHTAELERELEYAAVLTNKKKQLKTNTDIITAVFHVYFGVLKNEERSKALLSVVLEGLAKFAHLINVNFFDDLFKLLTRLIQSGELSVTQTLYCVQAGLSILSGQGNVLNIDPHQFYCHMFTTLRQLHATDEHAESTLTLLRCLEMSLNKLKRQTSIHKLLSFSKRAATVCLQQSPEGTAGLLMAIRSFLQADPKCDMLLDKSEEGAGLYRPEVDNPEYTNAGSSSLFELHLLRRHYDKNIKSFSSHLLEGAPSMGQGALPISLSHKKPTEIYELVKTPEEL